MWLENISVSSAIMHLDILRLRHRSVVSVNVTSGHLLNHDIIHEVLIIHWKLVMWISSRR